MRRTLIELLHIALGVAGVIVFATAAAWGVPGASSDIRLVAGAAVVIVMLMGLRPLRMAWAADRNGGIEPRREKV